MFLLLFFSGRFHKGTRFCCGLHVKNCEIHLGIFPNSGFYLIPSWDRCSNTRYSEARDIFFHRIHPLHIQNCCTYRLNKTCILKNSSFFRHNLQTHTCTVWITILFASTKCPLIHTDWVARGSLCFTTTNMVTNIKNEVRQCYVKSN